MADDVLSTRRLLLRPLQPTDAAPFARLFGEDRDAIAMSGVLPSPCTEEQAGKWIVERTTGHAHGFAIHRESDGLFVGAIGFNGPLACVELGFGIGRPFWGGGYASEAVRVVVGFAGGLGIAAIEAFTFPFNGASARVLEKNGFANLGRVTRNFPQRGGQRAVFHHRRELPRP